MSSATAWADDDVVEFVSLSAGGQAFCVDIAHVREIRRWREVTALPHADPTVLGVINLRGAVIPILDLSLCLGLGASPSHTRNVVIVASVNGRTFGILVSSVSEILSIRRDEVRENPTQMKENGPTYITGLLTVGEAEMLRVLDLTELAIKGQTSR